MQDGPSPEIALRQAICDWVEGKLWPAVDAMKTLADQHPQAIVHYYLAVQLEQLGFEEMLDSGAVVAVEWADRVERLLPEERGEVVFRHVEDGRRIEIEDKSGKLCKQPGFQALFADIGD